VFSRLPGRICPAFILWLPLLAASLAVAPRALAQTNCYAKPTGLIAWWAADGFALDLAGTNHGVLQGAGYAAGEAGQGFSFNGSSYVSVPDSPLWTFGSSDFSIELWAKFSDASGNRIFLGHDDGGGIQNKWLFWLNGGVLQFHINGPGNVLIGTAPFSPVVGQWYHLAVTRQVNTYRFFINGVLVSTDVNALTIPNSSQPLTIGVAEGIFHFNGVLDEISIYNRALSSVEVASIFGAGGSGKCFTNDPAPVFIQQPAGVSAIAGQSVSLTGVAMGSPRPTYQWLFESAPLIGATSATLTLNNVTEANAGTYVLVASNSFGTRQSQPAGVTVAPRETSEPSSRRTGMVFSEIMYKPASRTDTQNVEFVEIHNTNPWFHDVGGYRIVADELTYTFAPGTTIPAQGYFVIAASPAGMQNVYGISNAFGPYLGSLKKSGTLKLLDEQGAVLLTVPYSNLPPWPVAAFGAGHSLVLASPSYGEADPRAWNASDVIGGSPGRADGNQSSPLRTVVINEFLAHTDDPDVDYVELYNHGNLAVDISGCILTDDPATNKFVVPPGTSIPPRGFRVYTQTNLNFSLNAAGESIYFKNPTSMRVIDAVQFDAQENGVATGRWPDGAKEFYRLNAKTPGTNNATTRLGNVVINELMYHPISGNDDDQYIELYNRSGGAVNLGGWKLIDAVNYTFPSNVTIAGNGYLVVAKNATRLRSRYPNLNVNNTLGDFSGKLSGAGEHLALTMPEAIVTTNGPVVTTNFVDITVNDVTYGTGGRWGQWSDGGGSSLELIDPDCNNRLAANWADSDDTQKSVWTNIEVTGVLDLGGNYGSGINYAQFGLLEAGECLVDDLEVHAGTGGPNYVANPNFESGLANWSLMGCFVRSSIENTGYLSSRALHVRCSERIWTGANSCQVALSANSLASGQTATLRFKARWLRGWPEALFRLNGNWLEAAGTLPIPENLGTPGQLNSCQVANAGPAVFEITHTPSIPAGGQPVVVTARVHDPDGVQSLTLNYRLDPSASYSTVAMADNGTGGDAIAGDGIFSGTIPGQGSGTVAAFYLSAADALAATTRFPALRNDNGPVRECVVRFGDENPDGSFGVYHFWLTQASVNRWSSLPNLSNEENDATFVNGNRVIYNVSGRFAGSPFHQIFNSPSGSLCHYSWSFPDDDKMLGTTSFNKLHQPGNGPGDDSSLQREQLGNAFLRSLGVPWLYKRLVAVYVNGSRRGTLMEDTQVPGGDIVEEYFPDDADGYLYKMQPWFEFAPSPSGSSFDFACPTGFPCHNSYCNVMPYTTTGGLKKPARYRYMFLSRRTPDSAGNFTNVFSLVDAASSYGTPGYVANMENIADMENWMRLFAANHAAGNQDCFGAETAQNVYGYIGTKGTRYSLMLWDFNQVFGHSNWQPGQNLFYSNPEDPNTANIYNHPTFRRMYWRALQELLNGLMDPANSNPILDAKYNAFVANGLSVEDPGGIKSWIAQARSSITSQLAAENASSFTVNALVISNNVAILTGTAPVNVKTVWFNGVEYPLTWTSVTSWRATVPLKPGTNQFSVIGVNVRGQFIPGDTNFISAIYSGPAPSPAGQVVINEILYRPTVAGAEYVELYNNSSTLTFDLSGLQFNGLSYTFPAGSLIAPNGFLVLARNRPAFAAACGATVPVFDTFDGALQENGETLSLIKPGTNAATDLIVSRVRYENGPPWPVVTNTPGVSLQLIDPAQDNFRPANWAAMFSNAPAPGPQWVYVTTTGTASSSTLYIYLQSAGDLYLDDLKLVAGSVPEAGANLIANGDFESAFPGAAWTVSPNLSGSARSTSVQHSGAASLHVVSSSAGSSQSTAIYQTVSPALTNGATYALSFWYLQSTNGGPLTIRLSGSGISATVNPAPSASAIASVATPGMSNSVAATLPAFPALWINEVQAENLTGITNSAGQRGPWIEIYNPGTNAVALQNLYLSDNFSSLTNWSFPTNAVIGAGQFKVIFADGQTNLSTAAEWHANFTLAAGSGGVALSRRQNDEPKALDYVNYASLTPNRSYGSLPDAQSFERREFFFVTPGGTNNGTSPPLTVRINEWMADNTHTLVNPIGGKFDDWFELHNYGTNPANLVGFYLTDTVDDKFQFQIPPGYVIPPHGFLLVWADSKNPTGSGDLHVNFKLDKEGEAIGLFAADGTPVDYVAFGGQASDVSQGSYPDGGSLVYSMTATSPRTNNIFFNSPPAVAAISNRFLILGQTLSFTNAAVDPDAPPQSLSFSLGADAPAGAAINSSGWFVWMPSAAPATNLISVIAADNGTPGLSHTQTFLVTVLLPPGLSGARMEGNQFIFSWPTAPGLRYQPEYADDLESLWLPLGGPVTGSGGLISVTNGPAGSRRFFRLRILP
jgi:concanavalin A-like lectin/glucanase superfamily protein/lamin tail-like protein/CotH protein/Ig-like domain-containing protein